MIEISVITPVLNRADLTSNFLTQNWMLYSLEPSIEWIIIDNGSTDPTNAALMTWNNTMRHRLKVITNPENYGFSKASNQGVKVAGGEILVFLNNDVIVKGDYVGRIVSKLVDYPTGLVGAHLINYPTGWNIFGTQIIPYLAGWCLAMRAETFNTLSGFDERYTPADYEDIDLCYAAVLDSRPLIPIDLPLHHISNQTGHFFLPNRREITEQNKIKFAKKWGLKI